VVLGGGGRTTTVVNPFIQLNKTDQETEEKFLKDAFDFCDRDGSGNHSHMAWGVPRGRRWPEAAHPAGRSPLKRP
jgi:hypothetical protein